MKQSLVSIISPTYNLLFEKLYDMGFDLRHLKRMFTEKVA